MMICYGDEPRPRWKLLSYFKKKFPSCCICLKEQQVKFRNSVATSDQKKADDAKMDIILEFKDLKISSHTSTQAESA